MKKMIDTTTIKKTGAVKLDVPMGLIKVSGPDSNRFLQAQTTNDIHKLKVGDSQRSCLLDRKAKIVADFEIYKTTDYFYILANKHLIEPILNHLNKFIFADKVEIKDLSDRQEFLLIEGPVSRSVIKNSLDTIPKLDCFSRIYFQETVDGEKVDFFKYSMLGEEGYLVALEKGTDSTNPLSKLVEIAGEHGFKTIDDRIEKVARIESGILEFGIDYDTNSLLPETTLDESCVSYEKGCFQGQEVLARVKSHGAPTKALVGLTMPYNEQIEFDVDTKILFKEKEIGWIKSNCSSKYLKANIAIALMKRDFREPNKTYSVQINGTDIDIKIVLLPFYRSPSPDTRARKLYDQALDLFTRGDNETEPLQLLEEAISLNPLFEDAYESLGVILSKQNNIDKAIEVMLHLAKINPDSIMAHTNLSVFYLEKGWKEKAEEEKAISTTIQMLNASREAKAKEDAQKEQEKDLEETRERLSMFEQVLEIDPDDFLANYGKGSCLIALNRAEESIQYLKKALEVKPNHTVAYLDLAKAYLATEDPRNAQEILSKGTSVASRQGDLEPLKKMQALISDMEKTENKIY